MSEEQSIEEFFNRTYIQLSQYKKAERIKCLVDEGYDNVQELQSNSEQSWNKLSEKLSVDVVEDIRKKLQLIYNQKNQNFDTESILISNQQNLKIAEFINQGFPPQNIVKLMNAELGTPNGQAVLQKIKSLIQPSKPYPCIGRLVTHKQTQDQTLPLFIYESYKIDMRKYYTFLVIGETGSGKTTLLDAFVNKLTAMKLTDNWRWKLADESHLNMKQSKASKTSQISYYYINDRFNIFNMLIIDSPGFGDTSGLHVDDQITKKFKTFFGEIKQIDYVLWTIKSSDTRELSGSLYIYERIMELFGSDVKDKFIIMCTFADDQIPKCLQVLKGIINYQIYFKFNNSALYIPYEKSTSITKFFWQMGISYIDKFISYIQTKNVQPFSLQQSIEVIDIREQIIQLIKKSNDQMIIFQRQFKIFKQYLSQLRNSIQKIYSNTPYKVQVAYQQFRIVPLNTFYQFCLNCQVSCCQYCVWPSQSFQSKCVHFSSNYCPVCPGRCHRSSHIRSHQRIQKFTNYRQQIISYKKSEFDLGCSSAQKFINMLSTNKAAEVSWNIWQNSKQIKYYLKKIEVIALKPKFSGKKQFYEKMIMQESQNKRKGWQDHIKKLQQILNNLKYIEKVQESNTIYDLFPELQYSQCEYHSLSKQFYGIRP